MNGINKAFFPVMVFALLMCLSPGAHASKAEELSVSAEVAPILRFVVAGTVGASSMRDYDSDRITWSHAVGMGMELSLAGQGLTPIFQANYLVQNKQWFHSMPIDIGGRYVWSRGKLNAYVSGGMSLLIVDRKVEDPGGDTTDDWEVNPLVYVDLGTRIMFKRHFGLEIRLDFRTYVVVNVIGLKLGLAI